MYSVIALVCFSAINCEIYVPKPPVSFFPTATECVEGAELTKENLEEIVPNTFLIIQCVNWHRTTLEN